MNKSRWLALVAAIPEPGVISGLGDGWLDLVPELIPTRTTPQSPVHHGEGDVWTHTTMVMGETVTSLAYEQADPDTRAVLFLACLLHDIAKPSTTVIDPDGRIRQPGHSRRGAIDARALLWGAGAPFSLRERICGVITHHQVPFFGIEARKGLAGDFTVRKLSWEVRMSDLLAVARADIRGRIAADIDRILEQIDLMELLADDIGCLRQAAGFPDADTRYAYFRRDGAISPDYPFFEAEGPTVTFVCGMPGSGKDHWIRNNTDLPVVAYDDVRDEMDVEHGDDEGRVAQLTKERAREHLRAKQSFVWNATALQKTFRDPRIDLARQYGARVRIVHVEASDAQTWRKQNRERARSVPEAYLDRSLHRWELPLATEGHEVIYVQQGQLQDYLGEDEAARSR